MPFLSLPLAVRPQAPALVDGARTLTYRDLSREAEEASRRLVTAGVAPGDGVAILGPLDANVLAALHGVWMAGGAAAPLNPRWSVPELERALELLDPRVLLVAGDTPPGSGAL
ncbi:AMP-binding protein, partial [Gemmatimonadota bacterium]